MPSRHLTTALPRSLLCLGLAAAGLSLAAQTPPPPLPESVPSIPGLHDFPRVMVKASVCHASSRGVVSFSSGPSIASIPIRGVVTPEGLVVKTGAGGFLTLVLSNGTVLKLGENTSLRFDEFLQEDLSPEAGRTEEAFSSRLRLHLEEGSLYYTGPKLRSRTIILVSTPMGLAHIQGRQAYAEVRLRPGATNEVDILSNEGLVFVHPESLSRPPDTIKQGADNLCELRQSTPLTPINSTIRTQNPDFLKNCRDEFLRMDFSNSRIIWAKQPAIVGTAAELSVIPNVPASLLAVEPAVRYSP